MALKLIFLGPPGAGKGTIAQRLSESENLVQISTGDLLREEAKKDTESGKKIKEIMESGQYVDDETVTALVENKLKEIGNEKGFILDGFPRTIKQAELLEKSLISLDLKFDAAIDVEASDDVIIDRLSSRVQCSKCGKIYNLKNMLPKQDGVCDVCGGKIVRREDDKPKVVKMRLKTYRKKTEPLIEHYKGKGLLKVIDANGSLEENMDNIEKTIQGL